MFNFFRTKSVKSVLSSVFDALDDLEDIAQRQNDIIARNDIAIAALMQEQQEAQHEAEYADRVADKLRNLVEV